MRLIDPMAMDDREDFGADGDDRVDPEILVGIVGEVGANEKALGRDATPHISPREERDGGAPDHRRRAGKR